MRYASPGMGDAQDRELEQKLLANMRLADIHKLVEEAGPSESAVREAQDAVSARGKRGSEIQPRPPPGDKPKRTPSGGASAAIPAAGGGGGAGDMSLMTAMAGRLRNAEESAAQLRAELKKRDATIAELKASLARSEGLGLVRSQSSPPADASPPPGVQQHTDADGRMLKAHNDKLREMLRKSDAENRSLAKENNEMKAFLKDYGMHWVGNGSAPSPSSSSPNSLSPDPSAAGSPEAHSAAEQSVGVAADLDLKSRDAGLKQGLWKPAVAQGVEESVSLNDEAGPEALGFAMDPAVIAGNVKQLNFIAGEGEKEIAVGADGLRRFKEKALVAYVFYKNGIFARGGPLRAYALQESRVLVKDLMDGYFPWELKDEYPEGVPLRVEFRLQEAWGKTAAGEDDVPLFRAFAGAGQALGGGPVGANADEGAAGGRVDEGACEAAARQREVYQPKAGRGLGETLFRRLPEKVVRANGEVISVRNEIRNLVRGGAECSSSASSNKVVVEHVAVPDGDIAAAMSAPGAASEAAVVGGGGGGGGGEQSRLRIKTPDGDRVLELSLPYDATIEALRRAILAHLSAAGQAVGRFTLRTSFPARQFDRDSETLREAGLVPNASLFMTLV